MSSGARSERKALELGEPRSAVEAVEVVRERINHGGPGALALVSALVDAAAGDDDLARVGAGPLEDLLVEHGHDLVDEIDRRARRDPRFATAMRAVWWSSAEAGPEVTARLGRWVPYLRAR